MARGVGVAAVVVALYLCGALMVEAGKDFSLLAQEIQRDSKPLGANVTCEECTDIVNIMFDVAENATVRAEFEADINASCRKYIPKEADICIKYGDALVDKLLPWIDKELKGLACRDARAVCSNFVQACKNPCCATPTLPEKVRLSIYDLPGGNGTGFVATWTTLMNTSTHTVQWGTSNTSGTFPYSANGLSRTHTHGGWVGVVHSAAMTNLRPATRYFYRVGDASGGWSRVWSFETLPTNAGTSARPLRVLQIGDMGYGPKSDKTVAEMIKEVDAGTVDLVLHVGDVSYADGDMPHWDAFLTKIESISARVPYMTNPGNHELWYNFTAYRTMFYTPASTYADNRMFYSFNYGGVHFTQLNTETFEDTANIDMQQRDWLALDLKQARANPHRGMIIATGHRPFYCTNGGAKDKDCVTFAELLRAEAENLLVGYHADMVINAHMHGYERTFPVAYGRPTATNYLFPASPVYVVNGAGGNREGNDQPHANQPWSAGPATNQIGYARMTITPNKLTYDYVIASNATVFDSFVLIK
eukprot:m.231573 g.231573  ORF g.231573 m.231573 type:complete len:532 (-) comp18412_c0_seq1:113-1708(-)